MISNFTNRETFNKQESKYERLQTVVILSLHTN